MGHFYASIQGNRGEATRMGSKSSGIEGHVRGWNVGCRVTCYVDSDGKDHVAVELTNGSGHSGRSKSLGHFSADDLD